MSKEEGGEIPINRARPRLLRWGFGPKKLVSSLPTRRKKKKEMETDGGSFLSSFWRRERKQEGRGSKVPFVLVGRMTKNIG
jgi:hypothetical protein